MQLSDGTTFVENVGWASESRMMETGGLELGSVDAYGEIGESAFELMGGDSAGVFADAADMQAVGGF